MKSLIVISILLGLVGCSSIPKDEVVQRMDDKSERPSWATISKPTYVKDGLVYAIGVAEGSSNAKLSALGRVADNNAKTELSRMVSNEIGVVFQNVEEGVEGDNLSRFIGTEKSSLVAREISPEKRYWEKVLTHDEYGEKKLKIKMYSLVSIKHVTLKKMVRAEMKKNRGISSELKQRVDNQLDKMMEE